MASAHERYIRFYRANDLRCAVTAELASELASEADPSMAKVRMEQAAKAILQDPDGAGKSWFCIAIAYDGGEPVAVTYAVHGVSRLYIASLAVLEDLRRQGVGKALLTAVLKAAPIAEIGACSAFAGIRDSNRSCRAFASGLGFAAQEGSLSDEEDPFIGYSAPAEAVYAACGVEPGHPDVTGELAVGEVTLRVEFHYADLHPVVCGEPAE